MISFNKMSMKSLIFYYIATLFVASLIFLGVKFIFNSNTIFYMVLTWLLGSLLIFVLLLYLPIFYINYKYCITNDYIIVRRGVLFLKTHYLRREKISYVTVFKTPFSSFINSCTIVLTVPGQFMILNAVKLENANMFFKEITHKQLNQIEHDTQR